MTAQRIARLNEPALYALGFDRVAVEALRHLMRQIGEATYGATLPETFEKVETLEAEMFTVPACDGALLRHVEELLAAAPWAGPDNALLRRLDDMQAEMERTGIENAALLRRLDDMEVALQANAIANGALTRLTEELGIALQSAATTNSDLARRVATLENGVT